MLFRALIGRLEGNRSCQAVQPTSARALQAPCGQQSPPPRAAWVWAARLAVITSVRAACLPIGCQVPSSRVTLAGRDAVLLVRLCAGTSAYKTNTRWQLWDTGRPSPVLLWRQRHASRGGSALSPSGHVFVLWGRARPQRLCGLWRGVKEGFANGAVNLGGLKSHLWSQQRVSAVCNLRFDWWPDSSWARAGPVKN